MVSSTVSVIGQEIPCQKAEEEEEDDDKLFVDNSVSEHHPGYNTFGPGAPVPATQR